MSSSSERLKTCVGREITLIDFSSTGCMVECISGFSEGSSADSSAWVTLCTGEQTLRISSPVFFSAVVSQVSALWEHFIEGRGVEVGLHHS